MWIHQNKQWPAFTWDEGALAATLADLRHRQGKLLGRMEALGFDLRQEASLSVLTEDVVKSSAIEGEVLAPEEVRSSIASRLGIEVAGVNRISRDVEGVVAMMLDATQSYDKPLTKARLCDWHASLFPTGRSAMRKIKVGAWRTEDVGAMQVVSGPIGKEKVHFEAPSADRLNGEMKRFLKWFESDKPEDPVIKAALAHFYFVTIHPFEDGNGRIARAIADMALARADGSRERFYSMSGQIEKERGEYYRQLEKQQRNDLDVTPWLLWFLACLGRAIGKAEEALSSVLFKDAFWDKVNQQPVNERQRDVLNRMLRDDFVGHMSTSKYAKMAKCSNDTALRDIRELVEQGVLVQNPGGGRSTSYRLATLEEIERSAS